MAEHRATVHWERGEAVFTDNEYSRGHVWRFDGGIEVPASASPQLVPPPRSLVAAVDPEEAFVSALSSCHMLWFLSLAAKQGFRVDEYRDDATGILAVRPDGRRAITEVTLHPHVKFSGETIPNRGQILSLHEQAHEECFIANSVITNVRCEPIW